MLGEEPIREGGFKQVGREKSDETSLYIWRSWDLLNGRVKDLFSLMFNPGSTLFVLGTCLVEIGPDC